MELRKSQLKHLEIANEFKKELNTLLIGTELELFSNFIYKQISPLLSIALDLKKDLDINFYSNTEFGYTNMLCGGNVVDAYFYSLNKLRKMSDKNFWLKSKIYSKIKSFQLLLPYQINKLKFDDNELMRSKLKYKIADFNLYAFLYNKNNIVIFEDNIILQISELSKFFINKSNTKINLSFINNFIFQFLSKLYSHINYLRDIKMKNISTFYTGTGGNYFNILATYLGKLNNVEMIRFAHGFERVFFKDQFWEYELKGVDKYVNYSDFINKPLENIYGSKISFVSSQSFYYKKLFELRTNLKSKKIKKIILIGQSYLGEARSLTFDKLIDRHQFKIESKIIKAAKKAGMDIVYRPHPKGFSKQELLKGCFDVYFEKRDIKSIFNNFEFVIVTSISTAAIEAVLMGKKVIYLDIGIRKIADYFFHLEQIIKCVKLDPESNVEDISLFLDSTLSDFSNEFDNHYSRLNKFYNLFFNSNQQQ